VGSNAVVTKAVPANATVVGIPGRIIERPSEAEQKLRQDLADKFDAYGMSSDLPDPVAKSLSAILDHMHAVDRKLHCMAAKMKELDASYVDENLPALNVADFEAAIDPATDKPV
jgi:serine O-acetyltransferase